MRSSVTSRPSSRLLAIKISFPSGSCFGSGVLPGMNVTMTQKHKLKGTLIFNTRSILLTFSI